MSPTDGECPLASPPGEVAARQRCAVWLGPHGLQRGSALTAADRRSPWTGREFGAGQFVTRCSERDDSAAWNHLAGSKVELPPVMAAGPCAGQGPTRAPNSGGDTSLRVVTPAPHHGVYKRTDREAVHRLTLSRAGSPTCHLHPHFIAYSPADSALYSWPRH